VNSPSSIENKTYLDQIRQYREEALDKSYVCGRRHKLGAYTSGIVHAQWLAEDGSRAHLIDGAISLGTYSPFNAYPTQLRLSRPIGNICIEQTLFSMDLDDRGVIGVYHNVVPGHTYFDKLIVDLNNRAKALSGETEPVAADKELLLSEMQRGASGMFPLLDLVYC